MTGVMIVLLVSFFVAGGTPESDAGLEQRIGELLEKGYYESAAHLVKQALPRSPNPADLYARLGEIEVKRGDARGAFSATLKALAESPTPSSPERGRPDLERNLDLVGFLRLHGQKEVAGLILNGMLSREENYASALFENAYLMLDRRDLAGFLRAYYRAYRIDPSNPRAAPGYALLLSETGAIAGEEKNPWLPVVTMYYDNPRAWINLLSSWDMTRRPPGEQTRSEIRSEIPGRLHPFLEYYYHRLRREEREAAEAVSSLPESAQGDDRYATFFRSLMLEAGLREKAVEGLAGEPRDPVGRVLYYSLWTGFYAEGALNREGLEAFLGLIEAVTDFVAHVGLGEEACLAGGRHMLRSLVNEQISSGDIEGARGILESQGSFLSSSGCRLAAALLLQRGRARDALDWMKDEYRRSSGPERQASVLQVLDYAWLLGIRSDVEEFLDNAVKDGVDIPQGEYRSLLEEEVRPESARHIIEGVEGDYILEFSQPWNSAKAGACASAAACSIIRYYGNNADFREVSAALDALASAVETPEEILERFFGQNGLEIRYAVPTAETIEELLARNRPLVLIHTKFTAGILVGHVSVLYAYDDEIEKCFGLDVSDTGEVRLPYGSLVDADSLMVAAPKGSLSKIVSRLDPNYWLDDLNQRIPPEVYGEFEPPARYWALKHNAHLLREEDSAAALELYERALALRDPEDAAIYGMIVGVCFRENAIDKARDYMAKGLALQPDNLVFLKYSVDLRRDQALEQETLDETTIKELIELTDRMGEINPEFADTYFLRGDLFFRASRYEDALNAFRKYLAKFGGMNQAWQKRNQGERGHAVRAIRLCRGAIAAGEEAGG